ncbi:MAG: ankyrin repeat domain-containing protein [Candidatus Thiodiazotropha sp.]
MVKQAKLLAENQSAFLNAAESGDFGKVKKLLDSGIDLSANKEKAESALFLAASQGHLRTVQAILAASVNVDLQNGKYGTIALMAAAYSGHKEIVQALLAAKANLESKDSSYGKTALMWASEMGQNEVIEVLKDAGAK